MAVLADRVERWISRRHPPSSKALCLQRRQIYILPTTNGYLFFLTLFVLFLWAVNYSNSIGFALTFLLVGVALNAMWRCHNNLLGLRLEALGADPVFAGEPARFGVLCSHPDDMQRPGLCLYGMGEDSAGSGATACAAPCADIEPAGTPLSIRLDTHRRGWLKSGRIRVETRFPLGLFRAWSWIEFDRSVLVYPTPRGSLPLPARQPRDTRAALAISVEQQGSEDFSGLRDYRPGDSPRHVAWKASTRGDALLVKRFTGQARPELWLDWFQLGDHADEQRLEQLCRWVIRAEATDIPYGLKLPGRRIEPGLGPAHRAICLRELALHDLDRTPHP